MTYDVLYGTGTNGIVKDGIKFHQVLTAHTQNKKKTGELIDKDLYISMLYAAAHNVAGYSWFCYFPIVEETAASMVGFDGKGYGNGIDPNHKASGSYYDAAAKAGKQFEFIQGLLDGYTLKTRTYDSSKCLLTTTLTNGTNTITMYVYADTMSSSGSMKNSITVTLKGTTCYRIGYGLNDGEYYRSVNSGVATLTAGQAFICVK
jgi:hypothetical protein